MKKFNLTLTLPLVVLILLFKFSFITAQNSNCFANTEFQNDLNQTSGGNQSLPKCSFQFLWPQEIPENFKMAECTHLAQNVWKIVGDYQMLSLTCSAPYLIDFVYEGFQPNEAFHVYYSRDADMTTTTSLNRTDFYEKTADHGITTHAYGINVTLSSIPHLFSLYRAVVDNPENKFQFVHPNLTTPIIYPRTGRFIIRGMHDEHVHLSTEFYFFFEESLIENKPSFMTNDETWHAIYSPKNDSATIQVPCRPSHHVNTKNVTLTMTQTSDEGLALKTRDLTDQATFDATLGFKLDAKIVEATEVNLATFHFICSLNSGSVIYEADLKSAVEDEEKKKTKKFGLRDLTLPLDKGTFSVAYEVETENSVSLTSLTCQFDVASENATFFSVGSNLVSFTEFPMIREFVLPMYANLSYFTQKGMLDVNKYYIKIDRQKRTGAWFCSSGLAYKVFEFSVSKLAKYPFPFGTPWYRLPHQNVKADNWIRLFLTSPQGASQLYTFHNFTFTCPAYTVRNPIFWHTTSKNGARRLVFKDTAIGGLSKFETKLTDDINRITCSAGLYQSTVWRSGYVNLNISGGDKPKIIENQQFTYQFALDGKNKSINCQVTGDPPPAVWWTRKDGQTLAEKTQTEIKAGQAIHSFTISRESLGVYICSAKNEYGETEREFVVEELTSYLAVTIVTGILGFFILCGIVGALYYYFWKRIKEQILTIEELKEFREGVDKGKVDDFAVAQTQPWREEYEIPQNDYKLDQTRILGSGAFGIVFKGTVRGQPVAVKTVKPGSDKGFLKSLLSELKILMYLGQHDHLVQLIGASTRQLRRGIVFVFVELCEGGNLLSYLQAHQQDFGGESHDYQNSMKESLKAFNEYTNAPTVKHLFHDITQLHSWAHEIALGMAFLKTKKVIHGDLAARNVLLTAEGHAKITDFGLSRQLYSYAMYMKQSEEPLPWRWMSLESLCDLRFSCESDIWSYGVTLWELYSLGQLPFPNLNWDEDFVESLKNGLRLECPQLLPVDIFTKLLIPCWENVAKDRPSMTTIAEIIFPMTSRSQ